MKALILFSNYQYQYLKQLFYKKSGTNTLDYTLVICTLIYTNNLDYPSLHFFPFVLPTESIRNWTAWLAVRI